MSTAPARANAPGPAVARPVKVLVLVDEELARSTIGGALAAQPDLIVLQSRGALDSNRARSLLFHPAGRPDVLVASAAVAPMLVGSGFAVVSIDSDDPSQPLIACRGRREVARRPASMSALVELIALVEPNAD